MLTYLLIFLTLQIGQRCVIVLKKSRLRLRLRLFFKIKKRLRLRIQLHNRLGNHLDRLSHRLGRLSQHV